MGGDQNFLHKKLPLPNHFNGHGSKSGKISVAPQIQMYEHTHVCVCVCECFPLHLLTASVDLFI